MSRRPPEPPGASRPGWAIWLGVLALHALLVLWLRAERPPARPVPDRSAAALQWVDIRPPRRTERPPPGAVAPRPAPAPAQQPGPVPRPPKAAAEAPSAAPTVLALVPAPAASAASAPPPEGRLLDSAASRAALRASARQPLLAERSAQATGLPIERHDAALAQGVAAAVKTDCLKDGVGGGLLGLPVLALMAVRGDCAR